LSKYGIIMTGKTKKTNKKMTDQNISQSGQSTQGSHKKRILQKLAILAKYKKLNAVLTKESENMEVLQKGFQDQDEIAAIKQKLNI
jgi:hypothetical protein